MAINPYETSDGRMHRVAETTRRQFLLLMGVIGGLGATLFGSVKLLGFMYPAATSEDPPQFKTTFGFDDAQLSPRGVKSVTDKRVTFVRDDGGLYAVYLVCTHLGCTPNYTQDVAGDLGDSIQGRARQSGQRSGGAVIADGWKCPCHGSRYFIDSTNFYGPAPRPMDWISVETTKDGKFFVDRSKLVAYRQPGDTTPPTWRLQPDNSVKGTPLGV